MVGREALLFGVVGTFLLRPHPVKQFSTPVVVPVMFRTDLINGRWDEPLIQPHPQL